MQPFKTLTALAAPLDRTNVDTEIQKKFHTDSKIGNNLWRSPVGY